jgi:hypothetical protein
VSATLTVKREGVGIELRRAPLQITLDGAALGSVNRGETFEAPIEPGRHSLQIRGGRYSSRALSFEVAAGETAGFRCHPPMVWPRYLASILVPSLGISLKRQ